MDVQVDNAGALTVVRPTQPIAGDSGAVVKDRLLRACDAALGRVVLDLAAVPFVDGKGLEALADAAEAMAHHGQPLRMCGVHATLREAFALVGLDDEFEYFDDPVDAARSFL